MKNKIDIPELFKANRKRLGMTQGQMADHLQLTRCKYSSWEEGRACPKILEMMRISRRLGYLTIDSFLNAQKPEWKSSSIEQAYMLLPVDKRKIVDFILKLK